ncbi:hypothetical protein AB6D40_008865 [Vibrio cyclitrophicus]
MAPTKALVSEINKFIQQAVNPDSDSLEFEINGDKVFYHFPVSNDAVLFTQNHYDKGIQNGSLGMLTSAAFSGDS